MNKLKAINLIERLKKITKKDPSMDEKYFFESYALDINEHPKDEIELKYWHSCIKSMEGKSTKEDAEMSKKGKEKISQKSVKKQKCSDGDTISSHEVAVNLGINVNAAAHRIARVKKECGKIERKHLQSAKAYEAFINAIKWSRLLLIEDKETGKKYTHKDLCEIFPQIKPTTLSKSIVKLRHADCFSIKNLEERNKITLKYIEASK